MSHGADSERGFSVRPHPLFVVFFPIRQYATLGLLTLCAVLAVLVLGWAGFDELGVGVGTIVLVGVGLIAVRFLWAVLQWLVRRYGIERVGGGAPVVFVVVGVLNRTRSEVRVDALRNVVVDRPFVQRLFGLGSVGFATAGTGGYEVVWRIVARPGEVAGRVREAERAGERDPEFGPERNPRQGTERDPRQDTDLADGEGSS